MMKDEINFDELAPWLVVLLTLVGGFIRAILLGSKGMWLDETVSVWLAGHSVADMLQWVVRIDQNPPLYHFLLHFWMALSGDTAYYVRFLSVLLGAGTIPIIYLIGKRMSGVMMGLAAAAILTFSPFHIYYAQEARMYTLLTFNAAAAMYALVRLLTDPRAARPIGSQFREYLRAWVIVAPPEPGAEQDFSYQELARSQTGWRGWISRRRWSPIQTIETDLAWVALIGFSALTLLSHNTAVFFILAANIFVLGLMLFQKAQKSRLEPAFQAPSFWNWVKAQAGILILWSPWIPSLIKQAGAVYQRFWIPEPTWDSVTQVFRSFLNASGPIPADQAAVIWFLYAAVLCLGLVHYRKKIAQFLFLAVLFATPFAGELIVSIWRPIFWDRTLIWASIPLFLVLAAGIMQLKFRVLMIAAIGTLCTINLFSTSDYFRFYQKEDWKSAAGYVAVLAEKDDLVLFNSNFVQIPFNYYFKRYEEAFALRVVKRGVPQDLFDSGILEPEMTAADIPGLIALVSGQNRVWLVYSHDSFTDPKGLIPQTLAAQKKLIETNYFIGGQVQLYVSP